MASILDRYGIKEVADVTFYDINDNGTRGKPVLYLDTLKVSTIEQTAETSDARGGKGNPKLITWDYGKDITVTLEDALFSAKSLAIMFGNGSVSSEIDNLQRTVMARLGKGGKIETFSVDVYDPEAKKTLRKSVKYGEHANYKISKVTAYSENSEKIVIGDDGSCPGHSEGDRIFITYEIPVTKREIIVSADSFPGTYYVTGDTYARSDITGDDQFFQFIIPKAKVTSENTITLEAEGDPSVFNMNLTVLRPEDGEMMKLVQYDIAQVSIIKLTGAKEIDAKATTDIYTDVIGTAKTDVLWSHDGATGDISIDPRIDGEGRCYAAITGGTAGGTTTTITAKLASDTSVVGTHVITVKAV